MLRILEYLVALIYIVLIIAVILLILVLAIPVGILVGLYFIIFKRKRTKV